LRELEKTHEAEIETHKKAKAAYEEVTREVEKKSLAVRDAEEAYNAAKQAENDGTNQTLELSQAY
jgi:hypothetical protein